MKTRYISIALVVTAAAAVPGAGDYTLESWAFSAVDAVVPAEATARGAPQPTARWAPGDMNCDGRVNFADINPFVLALTDQPGYEAAFPGCVWLNADCNGDGRVSFTDINPFVALLSGPHMGGYWESGCLWELDERSWCPPDEIELTVEGGTLHTLHRNAQYNCCPDEIAVSLTVQGNVIRLDEEEILTEPCYCICCHNVEARVEGLAPGTYTVEYCWLECDTGQIECFTGEVVIP